MTARESDIRASANAVDTCPSDITGVNMDTCSVITNASKSDISSRIYGIPPTYTIVDETLPSGLQSKLDLCVDGVCNYVSYDFDNDTGNLHDNLKYVVNTRTSTTENSTVIIKKRIVPVSRISGDGQYVFVLTTVNHGFEVGGTINLSIAPYIGEFTIKSIPSPTTFQYESPVIVMSDTPTIPPGTTETIVYTPPDPVTFTAPPGYKYSSSAIDGTQISQKNNATQISCAMDCGGLVECEGFNFSSIGDNCELFSSISSTSNVATSKVSFIKEKKLNELPFIPEYNVDKSGRTCANMAKCNEELAKIITKRSEMPFFKTTDLSACTNCPTRSYFYYSSFSQWRFQNEYGYSEVLVGINKALNTILYNDVGGFASHVNVTSNNKNTYDVVSSKNSDSVLFSFSFQPPQQKYLNPGRNTIDTMYLPGAILRDFVSIKDLSYDYTYYSDYFKRNMTYRASLFKLEPIESVTDGFYIKSVLLEWTGTHPYAANMGMLTYKTDNVKYYKYDGQNIIQTDEIPPNTMRWYEAPEFAFILRLKKCDAGESFSNGICTACPAITAGKLWINPGIDCTSRNCSVGSYCPDGVTEITCKTCEQGQTTVTACTSSTDRVCGPCTTNSSCEGCQGKFWDGTRCAQCRTTDDCSPGSFCSTQDGNCVNCPVGECEYCLRNYGTSRRIWSGSECLSCLTDGDCNSPNKCVNNKCTYASCEDSTVTLTCDIGANLSAPVQFVNGMCMTWGKICGNLLKSCGQGNVSALTYRMTSTPQGCFVPAKGYYSPIGSTTAIACSTPGYYCPMGATSELKCPVTPAPGYTWANPGQDCSLRLCSAGTYCQNGNEIVCSLGSYCPGALPEADCPVGSYCSTPSTISACTVVGQYCPARSTSPGQCPAGSYCPSPSIRNDCPGGTYSSSTGLVSSTQCLTCQTGYYCPPGTVDMLTCPLTFYCPAGTSSTPLPSCPAGYYCPTSSTKIVCPVGSYCTAGTVNPYSCTTAGYYCPAGSSSPTGTACAATCSAGTYETTACTGSTNRGCSQCEVGYYCSGGTARTACTTAGYYCPAGSTSATGTACATSSCANNMTLSGCGGSNPGTCVCNSGTVSIPPGSVTCVPAPVNGKCSVGEYVATWTDGTQFCWSCGITVPTRYIWDNAGVTCATKQCPAGSYCPNATTQTACTSGNYCLAGSTSQTACAATCNAGAYESKACTTSQNRVCTTCSSGSSSVANSSFCFKTVGTSGTTSLTTGGASPFGGSSTLNTAGSLFVLIPNWALSTMPYLLIGSNYFVVGGVLNNTNTGQWSVYGDFVDSKGNTTSAPFTSYTGVLKGGTRGT